MRALPPPAPIRTAFPRTRPAAAPCPPRSPPVRRPPPPAARCRPSWPSRPRFRRPPRGGAPRPRLSDATVVPPMRTPSTSERYTRAAAFSATASARAASSAFTLSAPPSAPCGHGRDHRHQAARPRPPPGRAASTASGEPTRPRPSWTRARMRPASRPDRPTAARPAALRPAASALVDGAGEHHLDHLHRLRRRRAPAVRRSAIPGHAPAAPARRGGRRRGRGARVLAPGAPPRPGRAAGRDPPRRGRRACRRRSRSCADAEETRLFGKAEGEVHVLHGLPGRALHEVVERGEDHRPPRAPPRARRSGIRWCARRRTGAAARRRTRTKGEPS